MSDPTIPGGKKLCPSCTTYVGVNDSVCGNCGYNFDTGENAGGAGDTAGTPDAPLTVYSEGGGPPGYSGQNVGRVVGIVVLLFVLGIGGLVAFLVMNTVNEATDTVEDVFTDIDVDVPGIGDITFSPPDIGAGTNEATDFRSCVRLMNRFLKQVLANGGQPGDLPGILQDAATEMGIGSPEFRNFTQIYADNAGTAVTEGSRPAIKQAKKDAKDACEDVWG